MAIQVFPVTFGRADGKCLGIVQP